MPGMPSAESPTNASQSGIEAGATPAMRLATRAAQSWMAARLVNQKEEGPAAQRLARVGRYWLLGMNGEADRLAKAVYGAGARLSEYE